MVACFHPENIVATVIMQRLDVGSIGTERLSGNITWQKSRFIR
jgi:hypothetical protein